MAMLYGCLLLLICWSVTSSAFVLPLIPQTTATKTTRWYRNIRLLREKSNDDEGKQSPLLVFSGGGLFFYWQAGVVTYLRESGYDLSRVRLSGASAGALTATLTATNTDFYEATRLALQMSEEVGIWDRKAGLQGIWGPLIEDWLHQLIPNDATETLNDRRLSILVTPVPSFGKTRIDEFSDKDDLVRCNMASVHLPWFLDGKWTAPFRGSPHIDGSFLASMKDYGVDNDNDDDDNKASSYVWINPTRDAKIKERALEFVKVVEKEGIWDFVELGKQFAAGMDQRGEFAALEKAQR